MTSRDQLPTPAREAQRVEIELKTRHRQLGGPEWTGNDVEGKKACGLWVGPVAAVGVGPRQKEALR